MVSIAQIDRLGPAGGGVAASVLEHCRRRWWLAGRVDCRCRRVAAGIEVWGHRQTLADSAAAPETRVHLLSPPLAREALMMAGAGSAMRATGWRATVIRFQQFGEGSVDNLGCGHARARGGRRLQRSCEADRPARAGWAALRLLVDVDIFILAELLFADSGSGATMELGRSARPTPMSAWPGRAAAMVPAPVRRSQLWGHRPQIGNSAALT